MFDGEIPTGRPVGFFFDGPQTQTQTQLTLLWVTQ